MLATVLSTEKGILRNAYDLYSILGVQCCQ